MYIYLREKRRLDKPICIVKKLSEATGGTEAPPSPRNGLPGEPKRVLWPGLDHHPFQSLCRKGNGTWVFRPDRNWMTKCLMTVYEMPHLRTLVPPVSTRLLSSSEDADMQAVSAEGRQTMIQSQWQEPRATHGHQHPCEHTVKCCTCPETTLSLSLFPFRICFCPLIPRIGVHAAFHRVNTFTELLLCILWGTLY